MARNFIFKNDRVRLPDGREGVATLLGTKWIHVLGDDGRKSRHPVDGSDVKSLAPQVTLNESQGLYVIRGRGHYSCLGFDVCEERITRYAEWLACDDLESAQAACRASSDPYERKRQPVKGSGKYWQSDAPRGTLARFGQYELILSQMAARCRNGKRCTADLCPQLIGLEGKRVEVVTTYGETRRFQVGKSMGWLPIHLEIANAASHGGGAAMGPYKSVRVVS